MPAGPRQKIANAASSMIASTRLLMRGSSQSPRNRMVAKPRVNTTSATIASQAGATPTGAGRRAASATTPMAR